MNFISTLLIVCFLSPAVQTEQPKDGRYWNSLPPTSRIFFLSGFFEGWNQRGAEDDTVSGLVLLATSTGGGSFTYGNLASMVDSAYKDAENLSLPIAWVVMGSLAVQRGETTRDVVLAALRKHQAEIWNKSGGLTAKEYSPLYTIQALNKKTP
jgi:hypothetical protein